MANNELSGPAVATFLMKWIASMTERFFSYRLVFVPETIGAITYLSRNIDHLKKNIVAGFQLTCVGDDRNFSFMPSRHGGTLSDKVAKHILAYRTKNYKNYTFLERGSDERQYCAPGIDLPVVSIMRTKYGTFPEYHTSQDDLSFVSPKGLQGTLSLHMDCMRILENNRFYKVTCLGEPQLGRRKMWPTIGATKGVPVETENIVNFLAYCDGTLDVVDIATKINVYAIKLFPIIKRLIEFDLIRPVSHT